MAHPRLYAFAVIAACLAFAACGQMAEQQNVTRAPEIAASAAPVTIGDCADVTVASIGSRLEGDPSSGSAILYTNGMGQVWYEMIPGIDHSQPGDAVHLCLVRVPEDCPPGDERGRVYTATNARTGETWTAPDAQHGCGGA